MANSQLFFLVCFTVHAVSPTLHAQENYVSHELHRENNWDALFAEDMNGDGKKDLIYSHYDPSIGENFGSIITKITEHIRLTHSASRLKPRSLL